MGPKWEEEDEQWYSMYLILWHNVGFDMDILHHHDKK